MMLGIPRAPLVLGLAGLLPFIFAALVASGLFNASMGDPSDGGYPLIVAKDGVKALVNYGTVILSFMSGVLWGFSTKAEGTKATTGYILSVIPALWAFGAISNSPTGALTSLIIGFIGLLVLDYYFFRETLTPDWWMRLRILLTSIVVVCLCIGAYA